MLTSGRDLIESFELQLEHEPHDPPPLREKRSHACRAKYPAATATIEMARISCMFCYRLRFS
jgi:hypothetical protein